MDRYRKGSITVFLSLILLLVLALIGTLLEGARLHILERYTERALLSGMDTVLTEYYRPLYERYHLFFIEKGVTDMEEKVQMEEEIESCLYEVFSPDDSRKQNNKEAFYINLLQGNVESVEVNQMVRAVDYHGEIFVNEAIAYMKYKGIETILEKFSDKSDVVFQSEKVEEILNEKMEMEESFYTVNQEILQCMQLIDGVSTDKYGVKYYNNQLQTETYFVKMLCMNEISKGEVQIDNDMVWNALKHKYRNPKELLVSMKELLEEAEDNEKPMQQNGITTKKKEIVKICKEVAGKAKEAIDVIRLLESKQDKIVEELSLYKEKLNQSKEELSKEVYDGLLEDYREMEQYMSGSIKALLDMGPILQNNLDILEATIDIFNIKVFEDENSLAQMEQMIEQVLDKWEQYTIKGLQFTYGTLITKQTQNPKNTIDTIQTDGILNWVLVNDKEVSKESLSQGDILYPKYGTENNKSIENRQSDILETLLLTEYCIEHFNSYINSNESLEEEKHVLKYEQEYLLMGKKSDKENLKGVVEKIVTLRTVFNFMYLLTDSNKKAMAYTTAASIVGFTGIEPLIRVVQMSILLSFAYEEAIIDTAALLAGKQIPLFKAKETFQLNDTELFTFNKTLVKNKVTAMENKKSILFFSYEDYIRIFLLSEQKEKQSYRAMDLIEANMKMQYAPNFSIENCIYGFQASVQVKIKAQFFHILFVNRIIKTSEPLWEIYSTKSIAY